MKQVSCITDLHDVMIDSQGLVARKGEVRPSSSNEAFSDDVKSVDSTNDIDINVSVDTRFNSDLSHRRGVKRTLADLAKSNAPVTISDNISHEILPDNNISSNYINFSAIGNGQESVVTDTKCEVLESVDKKLKFQGPTNPTNLTSASLESDISVNNIPDSILPSNKSQFPRGSSSRRGRAYGLRPRNGLRRSLDDKDSPERSGRKQSRRCRGRGNLLSKYRRNTANARERDRMRDINTAFATLRGVLPSFACRRISSMTKITTLKLATSYIGALADLLKDPPQNQTADIQFLSAEINDPSTSSTIPEQLQGSSSCEMLENHHQNESMNSKDITMFGHYVGCVQECGQRVDTNVQGFSENFVEGRLEGRWWSSVENDMFQTIENEISFEDLNLPDDCWTLS